MSGSWFSCLRRSLATHDCSAGNIVCRASLLPFSNEAIGNAGIGKNACSCVNVKCKCQLQITALAVAAEHAQSLQTVVVLICAVMTSLWL